MVIRIGWHRRSGCSRTLSFAVLRNAPWLCLCYQSSISTSIASLGILCPEKHVLLFSDGHASRKGVEWIELCLELNIEIIILPANTANFLQPWHRLINKTFQSTAKKTRDVLLRMDLIDTQSMGLKIELCAAGHSSISSEVMRRSFRILGYGGGLSLSE